MLKTDHLLPQKKAPRVGRRLAQFAQQPFLIDVIDEGFRLVQTLQPTPALHCCSRAWLPCIATKDWQALYAQFNFSCTKESSFKLLWYWLNYSVGSSSWRTLWELGACNLYYRQSSSIKHLFGICNRTEAEQQQSDTKHKTSTNSILRILIAKVQSNNPESCHCSLLSFACVSIYVSYICSGEWCVFFYNGFILTFYHLICSRLVSIVSIKPSQNEQEARALLQRFKSWLPRKDRVNALPEAHLTVLT